jgi:hypothetical protein
MGTGSSSGSSKSAVSGSWLIRPISIKWTNPGRTANTAREHLRAILSGAWEQELIETMPRFPGAGDQRDIAGRHDLTKAEINAPDFATHKMARPRG